MHRADKGRHEERYIIIKIPRREKVKPASPFPRIFQFTEAKIINLWTSVYYNFPFRPRASLINQVCTYTSKAFSTDKHISLPIKYLLGNPHCHNPPIHRPPSTHLHISTHFHPKTYSAASEWLRHQRQNLFNYFSISHAVAVARWGGCKQVRSQLPQTCLIIPVSIG